MSKAHVCQSQCLGGERYYMEIGNVILKCQSYKVNKIMQYTYFSNLY